MFLQNDTLSKIASDKYLNDESLEEANEGWPQ